MHNSCEMAYPIKVEYAETRRMRERNTRRYRLAHLPIWVWVFFLAPGPWAVDLFAHGGSGAAIHSSLYRVQAEPVVSQDLLHVRVERGHYLHLAEPGRLGDCRRDR